LADVEKRGKMHHRRDAVPAERLAHRPGVRDVAFDQRAITDGLAMTRDKIVEHDDGIAGAPQRLASMAADVPGAPRHHDRDANSRRAVGPASGSYARTCAPSSSSRSTIVMAGASRMSSVRGLKARPHSAMVRPLRSPKYASILDTNRVF